VTAVPPPHPPSARAQRAALARPADAERPRGPRIGYFRLHWRGDLPLAVAVIASAALVWGAVQAARLTFFPYTESPWAAALLWLLEVALLIVGVSWWGMGVQRAAIRSVDKGGSMFVAFLTGVVGYGAFIWVGLFWLNSARHVWPDVKATLLGDLHPAAITLEPGGQLAVQGDLEFGTTRAVRQALAANPAVRTVRLESRGGRVDEGLALGRLLLDRNLDSLVTGECSSACVTAFVGGNRRMIGPAARIGLHSAGGNGVNAAHRVLAMGAATASDEIWFPEHAVLLASALATERARP
jgi:hypothetical protein